MKRRVVKVARMRIMDAAVGDVVNKDADALRGWFQVGKINTLFNGNLQLTDASADEALSGGHCDIIGVQFVSEVDVPAQPSLHLPNRSADDETDGGDDGEQAEDEVATSDASADRSETASAAEGGESAKPKGLREMLHQPAVN